MSTATGSVASAAGNAADELVSMDALPLRSAALYGTSGYAFELFADAAAIDEEPDFLCSLCKRVMRQAVVINGDSCGSYFCYQCLRAKVLPAGSAPPPSSSSQSSSSSPPPPAALCCPHDGHAFRLEDIYSVDLLNRKIQALRVRCHIAPDRCAAAGPLGAGHEFWRAHERICDFAPLECQFCKRLVTRRDHARHESHECAERRIRCVQCGEPDIPFGRLEDHLRECPHYEVNRLRADVNALRQTIVDAAAASQRAIDALTLALQNERGEREAAHAMALQIVEANRSAHNNALAAVQRASEQAAADAVGVATAVQDEWRRSAAQLRVNIDTKIEAGYADECAQRVERKWRDTSADEERARRAAAAEQAQDIAFLRAEVVRLEAASAADRKSIAALSASSRSGVSPALSAPAIPAPAASASDNELRQLTEKQAQSAAEIAALRLRVDELSAAVAASERSRVEQNTAIADSVKLAREQIATESKRGAELAAFKAYAEPLLQRFEASISLPSARPAALITESPSSARLLHSASSSSFTPLASATAAVSAPHHHQHPEAPIGQTWIHPGQWRKHKLLEYWSCCQTPATGQRDSLGCSLREEPRGLSVSAMLSSSSSTSSSSTSSSSSSHASAHASAAPSPSVRFGSVAPLPRAPSSSSSSSSSTPSAAAAASRHADRE